MRQAPSQSYGEPKLGGHEATFRGFSICKVLAFLTGLGYGGAGESKDNIWGQM